jgi:hypothetical protein
MGLETATFLNDLNSANPPGSDQLKQADDHLRLVKAVLQSTFPALTRAMYLEKARIDVADAATPALWAAASNYANLLGTTTITGFASGVDGQWKIVRFNAARQLTHNASTLNLPGAANITTVAGDHALVQCTGTVNNVVLAYFPTSGKPLYDNNLTPGFGTVIDIATASTVDLGTASSHYVNMTGAGTVTSFGSSANTAFPVYLVRAAAAIVLTQSSNLNLPDARSVTLANNDHVLMRYNGSGVWQVIAVYRNTGIFPTVQRFLSGSGTYTAPVNLRYIEGELKAGGGGGGATTTNNGANGADSSFGSWTAIHGNGGLTGGSSAGGAGGTGGVNGTGTLIERRDGQNGGGSVIFATSGSGTIGGGPGGGPGGGASLQNAAGLAGKANTGGGGGGGNGSGGGEGEYVRFIMTAAQVGASQSYSIGTGGAGGAAGGNAGGNAAAGALYIKEFY